MEELKLENLTLEQKLGQVICARGYQNAEDKAFLLEMIRNKAVGGIQIAFTDTYRDFIREIQETADYPILLYNDMERGFPKGEPIPAAIALGAVNDPEIAYEAARITAIEAKAVGMNAVCGPVVDISCPGALCKVERTFGDDTETISRLGNAMIRGYQDEGMLVMAKHYPGGSDMTDDIHIQDGVCWLDEQQLLEKDLVPYIDAIKNNQLSGIMTGHVLFPKIDPVYPATLSAKLISIIRKQGFEGVLITDSMAMMGICRKFGEREVLGLAMAAGHDMVLPSYRLTYKESFEALKEAYEKGVFSSAQLDAAVTRVLAAQHKIRKPATAAALTDAQKQLMQELSGKILCATTQDGCPLELDSSKKKLFVLLCENEYRGENGDASKEITVQCGHSYLHALQTKALLLQEFPGCEVEIIQEFPHHGQIEAVCNRANHCDEIVFFTFCVCSSYYADENLTNRVKYLIKALYSKVAAIFHVGNPYAVEPFQDAARLLIGFAPGQCEAYAIKALKGEYVPPYTLPVHFRPLEK